MLIHSVYLRYLRLSSDAYGLRHARAGPSSLLWIRFTFIEYPVWFLQLPTEEAISHVQNYQLTSPQSTNVFLSDGTKYNPDFLRDVSSML